MTPDRSPPEIQTTNVCREAFEANTRRLCVLGAHDAEWELRRKPNDNYAESRIQAGWMAWQDCWRLLASPAPFPVDACIAEIKNNAWTETNENGLCVDLKSAIAILRRHAEQAATGIPAAEQHQPLTSPKGSNSTGLEMAAQPELEQAIRSLEYCAPGELGIKLAAVFRAITRAELAQGTTGNCGMSHAAERDASDSVCRGGKSPTGSLTSPAGDDPLSGPLDYTGRIQPNSRTAYSTAGMFPPQPSSPARPASDAPATYTAVDQTTNRECASPTIGDARGSGSLPEAVPDSRTPQPSSPEPVAEDVEEAEEREKRTIEHVANAIAAMLKNWREIGGQEPSPREIAKTAIGASMPQAGGEVWQLIETAPKDGTAVDLWLGDDEFPMRAENCAFRSMTESEYWAADKPLKGRYWFDCHGYRCKPTHWMPLPKPPASAGREGA
jgi:hypothetical protein